MYASAILSTNIITNSTTLQNASRLWVLFFVFFVFALDSISGKMNLDWTTMYEHCISLGYILGTFFWNLTPKKHESHKTMV